MADGPIDLGEFGALVQTCEAIPRGEMWTGPVGSDPMAAFGPGTTAGGRAEAGWLMVGKIDEDGLTFVPRSESDPNSDPNTRPNRSDPSVSVPV